MKDREAPPKSPRSVDEFFRSVYDSLSVKVLAESAANAPSTDADDELDALEAQIRSDSVGVPPPDALPLLARSARSIEQAAIPKARAPEKKRARS